MAERSDDDRITRRPPQIGIVLEGRYKMLETSIQFTCDGCGETEVYYEHDVTRKTVRMYLKERGWKSFGTLDYCPRCITNGNARKRVTDMNH